IMAGSRLLTGAGYLLRVPAIDLAEVGAGGGSLVWIDPGGGLQVGPQSAGAFPGPLCYDLGGTEPTVTDANVILGFVNPTQLAGGAVKLNAARAHDIFEAKVARRLGLPLAEAAYGAHVIAASNMMRAIRAVSSERGRDPREYALFAFGGNGPVFAAGMARQLEMRRIVVPPAPGLFSSFGLLFADVEHHYVRTWRRRARSVEPSALGEVFARMEAEARAQLAAEGFTGAAVKIRRSADCRYEGQSFELTVPVAGGPVDVGTLAGPDEACGRGDARAHGHRGAGRDREPARRRPGHPRPAARSRQAARRSLRAGPRRRVAARIFRPRSRLARDPDHRSRRFGASSIREEFGATWAVHCGRIRCHVRGAAGRAGHAGRARQHRHRAGARR